MDDPGVIICAIFVLGGLGYLIFYLPKAEEKKYNAAFDNQVLGCVEGLYLAGDSLHGPGDVRFGCTLHEIRSYVQHQLSLAHQRHDSEPLIQHTTARGRRYTSSTARGAYALFAILCIVQYAKEQDNEDLITWCESVMLDAGRIEFQF